MQTVSLNKDILSSRHLTYAYINIVERRKRGTTWLIFFGLSLAGAGEESFQALFSSYWVFLIY
jgi:hypothetical protein